MTTNVLHCRTIYCNSYPFSLKCPPPSKPQVSQNFCISKIKARPPHHRRLFLPIHQMMVVDIFYTSSNLLSFKLVHYYRRAYMDEMRSPPTMIKHEAGTAYENSRLVTDFHGRKAATDSLYSSVFVCREKQSFHFAF